MNVSSNASSGGLWIHLQNHVAKRPSVISSGDFAGIFNTPSRAESSNWGDNCKPSFLPRVNDGQSKGSDTPETLSFKSCELADMDLDSEAFYYVELPSPKSSLYLSQNPTSESVEVEVRFRAEDEVRFRAEDEVRFRAEDEVRFRAEDEDRFGTSKDGEVEEDRFGTSKDGEVEGDQFGTCSDYNNVVNRKRRYPADNLPSVGKTAKLSLRHFL